MLSLSGQPKLFLCKDPINMKKSFEGLGGLVERLFPGELFNSCYFIFFNRRRNHLKVLYWDNDGFAIWMKRLEKGAFCIKTDETSLSRKDFLMILEGITPKRIQRRFSL